MTLFDAAKNVSALECAERYTTEKIERRGRKSWMCCPLHGEKTASLCFDDKGRFYCFGCHAHGTSIDFTAALFGLTAADAARKVCQDFGAEYDQATAAEVQTVRKVRQLRETLKRSASFTHAVQCGFIRWADDQIAQLNLDEPGADDDMEYLLAFRVDAEQLADAINELEKQPQHERRLYALLSSVKQKTLEYFGSLSVWDDVCGTKYVAGVRA